MIPANALLAAIRAASSAVRYDGESLSYRTSSGAFVRLSLSGDSVAPRCYHPKRGAVGQLLTLRTALVDPAQYCDPSPDSVVLELAAKVHASPDAEAASLSRAAVRRLFSAIPRAHTLALSGARLAATDGAALFELEAPAVGDIYVAFCGITSPPGAATDDTMALTPIATRDLDPLYSGVVRMVCGAFSGLFPAIHSGKHISVDWLLRDASLSEPHVYDSRELCSRLSRASKSEDGIARIELGGKHFNARKLLPLVRAADDESVDVRFAEGRTGPLLLESNDSRALLMPVRP